MTIETATSPLTIESVRELLHRPCRCDDHGGGVEVLSVEGERVRIRYYGACAHCLSHQEESQLRLQEQLRQHFHNDHIEVRIAQGVSDSLLEQARRILHHD